MTNRTGAQVGRTGDRTGKTRMVEATARAHGCIRTGVRARASAPARAGARASTYPCARAHPCAPARLRARACAHARAHPCARLARASFMFTFSLEKKERREIAR